MVKSDFRYIFIIRNPTHSQGLPLTIPCGGNYMIEENWWWFWEEETEDEENEEDTEINRL